MRSRAVAASAALLLSAVVFGAGGVPVPAAPQTISGLTFNVKPRIVTPNGDGRNDTIHFKFDTALSGVPVEARILDINGARVASLPLNASDDALLWNGRDDAGNTMPSGIYIYAIKIGKNTATGTVVVAR